MASRRRPWVAVLLSLLAPGVGQLYAGKWRRAATLFLLFAPVGLVVGLAAVLLPLPVLNLAIPLVTLLALRVLIAIDAGMCARAATAGVGVPVFARWYSCIAAVLLVAATNPVWAALYRTTFVEAYRNVAGSMQNTILRDEHILAIKWAYGWRDPFFGRPLGATRDPQRLDLVVFRFPEDRSRVFIKRLIGLPGETVEIRGKLVFINGRRLDEPYAVFVDPPAQLPSRGVTPELEGVRDNWGPETIPPDMYFVLGDFRDNSRDSRYWGFLPRTDLLGRGVVVYWSWDTQRAQPRWARLGTRIG